MGIFVDDNIREDANQIARTADRVQQFWNRNGRGSLGFRIRMSTDAAVQIAIQADEVLSAAFPNPPSKFKRIGTLLVLSRLIPLFGFYKWETDAGEIDTPIIVPDHTAWLVRSCYLLVFPAFRLLKWEGATLEKEVASSGVPQWRDFPSIHLKTEFLLFLEWLRDYGSDELSYAGADQEILDRRCRMVLATSLVLESAYYCRECPKPSVICGACDEALRRIVGMKDLLEFDKILFENCQKRRAIGVIH